ncbi:hypothetical protein [Psychrobacter sp. FDAARGOS_221]|uniref:hypothetical protein n=1 Tax=Psychrobacter sp. FDAARGOS_221 TaxID=1975705 RepID=UPI000BB54DEB|nr:hypothetical protein [Psychrobacter sp. FDAARGOS_221]PNK61355.1 hypothetical protein A6J60_011085 [Psychrobacter sp. FDAARGOS_221]
MTAKQLNATVIQLVKKLLANHGDKVVFQGSVYPEHWGVLFYWLIDGKRHDYGFDDEPHEVDEILELMRKELDYEQFTITADKSGEITFETRHIPEEDSWPGLHMRRVSELEEHELGSPIFIPKKDWEERKALAEMPDNERITILLGDELNAHIDGEQGVQLKVDMTDDANPTVKLARLMKDGSINDIELHPLTKAWLIKQSRELRASPPYAKTPWAKMTVNLDNQGEIKMNFEYLD